jgi:hypothetical protein
MFKIQNVEGNVQFVPNLLEKNNSLIIRTTLCVYSKVKALIVYFVEANKFLKVVLLVALSGKSGTNSNENIFYF